MYPRGLMTILSLLLATCCCQAAVVMTTANASTATNTEEPPTTPTPLSKIDSDIDIEFGNKFSCFQDHPSLQHGYFEVVTESGQVITPQCHPGFRLVGGDSLICDEKEQRFLGIESKCEDIDECTLMEGDDVTSSALCDDEEYDEGYDFRICHQAAKCVNTFGSFKCECKEGFEGNGFECKSKTGDTPRSCGVPDPPPYGVLYPIDSSNIRVLCHPDYSIHGHRLIKCTDGKWDPLPKCIPGWKSCGDPGVPKNGYRKGNRYNQGANIRFYCRNGFKIQGSRLRMCLEPELKWTGIQPQCIASEAKTQKEVVEDVPPHEKILHRQKRI